jgi:uncharacterized protein YwgA
MTSTQNKGAFFSMEDLEKGLMLAGFVSPNNYSDIHERNKLEEYEHNSKKNNKIIYFKRVVLAARIASELYDQPTFGRIKFQKMVYMCEHVANLKLEERYSKQAAGPFDNKFMHSIEKEFKSQKWFEVVKVDDGQIKRSKYEPLANVAQYKKYYDKYFSGVSNEINHIVELFKTQKTDTTEIAATLIACYLEIINNNEQFSENRLLEIFYSWAKEKQRFSEAKVKLIWQWVIGEKIIKSV